MPDGEATASASASTGQQDDSAPWQEQAIAEKPAESLVAASSTDPEQAADADIDQLAGLGSVDDIAAAALQAANIADLFGLGTESQQDTTGSSSSIAEDKTTTAIGDHASDAPAPIADAAKGDAPRGTKRSHDQVEHDKTAVVRSAPVPMNGKTSTSAAAATASSDLAGVALKMLQPASIPSNSTTAAMVKTEPGDTSAATASTTEEEDELLRFSDLEAVAQAAMGLDADGNPLPGNEESHRALSDAVKRLSAAQGTTVRETLDSSYSPSPSKRFQCTQCDRAFARAYNLNTHIATHDPNPARSKPFPCPYPSCKSDGGRSFSRKHDLQRHVASTHENEPEPVMSAGEGNLASLGLATPGRKFRCEDCGRAFVRRDALKRHQCNKALEPSAPNGPPPDYYTNPTAGLSLYSNVMSGAPPTLQKAAVAATPMTAATTTLPVQPDQVPSSDSVAGSSYDSDPFGPNGITYEHLSKEVQDMAMQLVAQAQSYNEQESHAEDQTQQTPQQPQPQPSSSIPGPKADTLPLGKADKSGFAPTSSSTAAISTAGKDADNGAKAKAADSTAPGTSAAPNIAPTPVKEEQPTSPPQSATSTITSVPLIST